MNKRSENFAKRFLLCRDGKGISCVAPKLYAERFQRNVAMKFTSQKQLEDQYDVSGIDLEADYEDVCNFHFW